MFKYFILTIFVFLAFHSEAQPPAKDVFTSMDGVVEFVSEAPLELIKASSTELRGVIDASNRSFAFTISTQSFKGFNSLLQQEHFYENYIESGKFPEATFTGKIIENINLFDVGSYTVRAKGILTIHGVSKERVVKVKLLVRKTKIEAVSVFEVFLKDHDIMIPKMVYQKISEQITLSVKLNFQNSQ